MVVGPFKRMQQRAAGNAEIRFLNEYREWVSIQEAGTIRALLADGVATNEDLGVRAADGHRRVFDMVLKSFSGRGVLAETGRLKGVEMLCISQWLDHSGSSELYSAMLDTLRERGQLPTA